MEPSTTATSIRAGDEVEVRQRFTAGWSGGFQVDDVDLSGSSPEVWLRRSSDGERLPLGFSVEDIRRT
jgi:hypothetical protein